LKDTSQLSSHIKNAEERLNFLFPWKKEIKKKNLFLQKLCPLNKHIHSALIRLKSQKMLYFWWLFILWISLKTWKVTNWAWTIFLKLETLLPRNECTWLIIKLFFLFLVTSWCVCKKLVVVLSINAETCVHASTYIKLKQ